MTQLNVASRLSSLSYAPRRSHFSSSFLCSSQRTRLRKIRIFEFERKRIACLVLKLKIKSPISRSRNERRFHIPLHRLAKEWWWGVDQFRQQRPWRGGRKQRQSTSSAFIEPFSARCPAERLIPLSDDRVWHAHCVVAGYANNVPSPRSRPVQTISQEMVAARNLFLQRRVNHRPTHTRSFENEFFFPRKLIVSFRRGIKGDSCNCYHPATIQFSIRSISCRNYSCFATKMFVSKDTNIILYDTRPRCHLLAESKLFDHLRDS